MTESPVSYNVNDVKALYERIAMDRFGYVPNVSRLNRMMLSSSSSDYANPTAFKGRRDYAISLGYKEQPTVADFRRYYNRTVAKTIVDQPPRDTWKRPPKITEDGNVETAFAQAWLALEERLRIFHYLQQADRLARIGEFGILLFGVNGGADMRAPVARASQLLYLRAHSQETVDIQENDIEQDPQNERFGLPTLYTVHLTDRMPSVKVHWTRVLHLAEDKFDSEIRGIPPLLSCLNLIDDLVKLVGGGAESAWLNMRPGGILTNQPGYKLPQDADSKAAREDQFEEYAMGILRILPMQGIQFQNIPPSVADMTGQISSTLDLIAMVSRIPKRVLLGSASGELSAASEDTKQWFGLVADRQKAYAEPMILRPCINWLVRHGLLPEPRNGYEVGEQDQRGQWHWPKLYEQSELELSDIESKRVAAAASSNVLTEKEVRRLHRHPAEPEPEMAGPTLAERQQEQMKQQTQGAGAQLREPERPTEAMRQVAANYLTGAIDEEELEEFVIVNAAGKKGPGRGWHGPPRGTHGPGSQGGDAGVQAYVEGHMMPSNRENIILGAGGGLWGAREKDTGLDVGTVMIHPGTGTIFAGGSDVHGVMHSRYDPDSTTNYDDFVKLWVKRGGRRDIEFGRTPEITAYLDRITAKDEMDAWEKLYTVGTQLQAAGFPPDTKFNFAIFGRGIKSSMPLEGMT